MSYWSQPLFTATTQNAILGTNWTTRSDVMGATEVGGVLVPSNTGGSQGRSFGTGDLAIVSELTVNSSATIPADPGASTPTGWTVLSNTTFTDTASRGCRYVIMAKVLANADVGTRVRYAAIPASGGSSGFRSLLCTAFYMKSPVRSFSFASLQQTRSATNGATIQITLPTLAQNGFTDCGMLIAAAIRHSITPAAADSAFILNPLKGSEYFAYDGDTRNGISGNDGITSVSKLKYNAWAAGEPIASDIVVSDTVASGLAFYQLTGGIFKIN